MQNQSCRNGRNKKTVNRKEMSSLFRPSSCVAHLILSGTAGWALKHTKSHQIYALLDFSILFCHSIIGAINFGHPEAGKRMQQIYDQTLLISESISLPIIVAQLYRTFGYPQILVYVHLVSAFIPILMQFLIHDWNNTVLDIVIVGNIASLIYYAIDVDGGPWAVGLIALTALNHFIFKRLSQRFEIPTSDVIAVGFIFFIIFSVNCINDHINFI